MTRMVTGDGRFTAGLAPDGVLSAAFVRGTHAHALLRGVDLSAAGVAAFAADHLGLHDLPSATGAGPRLEPMARPPLARGRLRFVGEPVAVVVAGDPYVAADAAERVVVDAEPLPVVSDPADAARDGTLLFPEAGTNTLHRLLRGAAPPPDATVRVTVALEHPRLAPFPVEPLAAVALPGDPVVLHCSHQTPHRLRRILAEVTGLALEVVVGDVGGGFGLKGMIHPEYAVVAALAARLGRPVRWVQTRSEQFLAGTHGRGQRQRITIAGRPDGRMLAVVAEILADVGAYPHNGSAMPLTTAELLGGPYRFETVAVDLQEVVTNRAPTGAYRGAGRPEAAYALERAVDAFAARLGLDPVEVRRRNLVPAASMPYRSPTGVVYDSGDYAASLDLALELADAGVVRAEQAERRADGRAPIGLGVGLFVERSGGRGTVGEHGTLTLDRDGCVRLAIGSQSTGQSHEHVWAGLVATALALEPGRVRVVTGDTRLVADGVGSFGSRSAQAAGSLIALLAGDLRVLAAQRAADLMEVAPADLELRPGGAFIVRGDPSAVAPLGALGPLEVGRTTDLTQAFPYGAYVAVVEVDLETGRVGLRRLVAVDDCGCVLDGAVVEGQVHGSVAQGVGQALYEGVVYDAQGQPLTSTLVDYAVPGAPDLVAVRTGRLETPAPGNLLGVKGIGEAGCIGAPPAIVNATLDALRPHGVTHLDMPLTPQSVWAALKEGRRHAPVR
jgi:carbon-monoxide dehydrogenase large subunit